MYKLYYSPGACSAAVHALLNELGHQVELININGKNREKEYLEINSRGQVPTLIEDGKILKESLSIMLYLAEKYGSSRLPSDISEKQRVMEKLAFYNSNLHQTFSAYFMFARKVKDGSLDEGVLNLLIKRLQNIWDLIERDLEKRDIENSPLTIADFMLAVIYNWCQMLAKPVSLGKNTTLLCKRVVSLPCFIKTMEAEGIKHVLS